MQRSASRASWAKDKQLRALQRPLAVRVWDWEEPMWLHSTLAVAGEESRVGP